MSNKLTIYVFIGPPGSGKGSLSGLCVTDLGWKQLSTGNLCRKHISEQTAIGKQIDFAINSGILVSDSLISAMVENWLENSKNQGQTVIFDGYPRTVPQAQSLVKWLEDSSLDVDLKVIKLSVSDDVVIDRLSRRYICQNSDCQTVYSLSEDDASNALCTKCAGNLVRRKDDEPDSIKDRLVVFHQHARGVEDFLVKSGFPVITVNAEQPLQEVFHEFKQLICVDDK
ncbi:nucleoside monophosphate kinase [Candidatus Dependentiae bacterium]|nr:nucleoside monophosphate kinase [Candidatus Dependentiae bacterium]